jgi:nucleoside-diphosphate-sugar epimerase
VLITGLRGFTGRYLQNLLLEAGYEVAGLTEGPAQAAHEYQVDVRDGGALREAVAAVRPDYAVHLAAISFVAHRDVGELYDVNIRGTLNLVEALCMLSRPLRKLLFASSGNVYGAAAGAAPIDEDVAPQPLNHYGVSKLAAEQVVRLAADVLPSVITRTFNYTGVGQAGNFIVPKLVTAFRNREPRLNLGNIDTIRDFSDVRWIAQTYLALLESDYRGTVNVCSGRGVCVRDILEALQRLAGYQLQVDTDTSLLRNNEIPALIGSTRKLQNLVPPAPCPALAETLEWMYTAA